MKKRNKIDKVLIEFIDFFKEEWKFLIFCLLLCCILLYPVDYYITTGGGISNIDGRVEIEDSYKTKGSLNISYVTQANGTVSTYLFSYIMPNWEREKVSDYQLDEEDSLKDIEFRNKLDLKTSNSNATYYGYSLAKQNIELKSSSVYVIYLFKEYKCNLKVGDEIISVDGNKYNDVSGYSDYINSMNTGDYVTFKVLRNNKEVDVKTKIYNNKDKKIIGVALQTVSIYKTDKKIKFKFKSNESGPSGGLMTTLDIYNKLTKEDITHGLKIAGTGTIESDGSIGEIGGVKFKVLGAGKKKADIFLVPEGNYKECINTVKKNKLKIKVVKVKNVNDAIDYLNKLG